VSAASPDRVFAIMIDAPRPEVWRAVKYDTAPWYFGTTLTSTWEPEAPLLYAHEDGTHAITGTVLAVDEEERMLTTFRPVWSDAVSAAPETEVEWKLEDRGPLTLVVLVHRGLPNDSPVADELSEGWVYLLSNLKTWVETDRAMTRVSG
jgi:uncharacterized protein YndB with AHSA1/START domain